MYAGVAGVYVCAGWLIFTLLPALPQEHREGEAFVVHDLAWSALGLSSAGRQVLWAININDPSQTTFLSICVPNLTTQVRIVTTIT